MTDSTIAEQFARQGIEPRDVALRVALAAFRNSGGTAGRAMALVQAAFELEDGQRIRAERPQSNRQPLQGGPGQRLLADKATKVIPGPAAPNPAYVKALKRNAPAAARTVLDTFRVRGGKPVGDVTFGELESLRARSALEAGLLARIQKYAGPNVDTAARVRDIVPPDLVDKALKELKRGRHAKT